MSAVLSSLLGEFVLDALVGMSRTAAFRLLRKSTGAPWDVSGATSISLNVRKTGDGQAPLIILPLNSAAPGADWVHGRLVFTISQLDVTGYVGSYDCALVGVFTGIEQAIARGRIDVLPCALTGPPPPSGAPTYNASSIFIGANNTGVTLPQGAMVARTHTGIVLAGAGSSPLPADGILLVALATGTSGIVLVIGSILLPDWTAITGTSALAISTPYYLSATLGKLTTTLPASPGSKLLQLIGQSEDGQTLDLQLGTYSVDL